MLALKRSGNHAIVQWILDNIDGRWCFLNNCRIGESPFFMDWANKRDRHGEKGYLTNIDEFDIHAECAGRHTAKDYLLYSYEDRTFDEIEHPDVVGNRERNVGTSNKRMDVIALRDPFNNIASMLKMSYEKNSYIKHRLKRQFGLAREVAERIVRTAADS